MTSMSVADLSSLAKHAPLLPPPSRVHVPLLLNSSNREHFIAGDFDDRRKSNGGGGASSSDGPPPPTPALKFSENSLGWGRGDAVAAAAAAAADSAASQPQASPARNGPNHVSSSSSSRSSSIMTYKHVSLDLDLICEPSILPLTCRQNTNPSTLNPKP